MDYNVTLLIFGILLLLTGLIGKIKAKELEIGTESPVVRAIVGLIGGGLVILSLFLSPAMDLFNGGGTNGGGSSGGSTDVASGGSSGGSTGTTSGGSSGSSSGSSSGGAVTTVQVPDIVGGNVAAARAALAARGLTLGSRTGTRQTDQIAPGNIVTQSPAAGSTADRGSAVSFETAVAPPAPTPTIAEDCIRHNPDRLKAEQVGGRWKVTEGSHWLLDFGSDGASAQRALQVLQFYRADRICYVSRPNPPMMYILSGDTPPSQPFPGEDCIGFSPGSLTIRQEGSQYLLASSSSRMLMFPDRASAEKAVAVIAKYGFTRQCFVGRPNPDFKYFRR